MPNPHPTMKRALLLFAFLCGLTLLGCTRSEQGEGMESDFVRITERLSSSTINDIVEDKLGYIWIATDRGLNKYNGYDYHNYFHTSNPNSLIDNQVKHLLCDSRGIIWVGTPLGLCYYTKEDRFEQVELQSPTSPIANIHETAQGRIVVRSMEFVEVFDWNSAEGCLVPYGTHKLETPFCTTFSDRDGSVWIVYPDRLTRHDFDTLTSSPPIMLDGFVSNAFMHQGNFIYLTMWDGTVRFFNTTTEEFKQPNSLKMFAGGVNAIMDFLGGSLLICTADLKYYIFNPQEDEYTPIEELKHPVVTPNGVLSTTLIDSKGNIWFGSKDQGISVHYTQAKYFNTNSDLIQAFGNKSVVGLAEDSKGNIYISTFKDGLWRWNMASGSIQKITIENKPNGNGVSQGRIFIDNRDNIYLNYPFIVAKLRQGRNDNELAVQNIYFVPSGTAYDLMCDSRGRVWAGTNQGSLFLLGENPGQITEVPIEQAEQRSAILTPEIVELADGRILALTLNVGITIFDGESLEQTTVLFDDVLDDVFIPTAFRIHSNGEVWIGTRGQGLFVFNPADNTITAKGGIHCKEIMEIIEVADGDLWISTMEGLSHWDSSSDKFYNYFTSNGTGGDQYNESVGLLTSKGALLFGGTHGLTYFNPQSVSNRRTANLYIEDLYINNTLQHSFSSSALDQHITEAERIELRHNRDANVGFTFAAIDYCEYPSIHYRYRMEGFDEEWIDSRGSRTASYSNLPAGRYRFAVQGWNNDYSQLVGEDSVEVVVRSHPLLSPVMCYGIYPILLFLALVAFYQHRRRSKRQREEMAQAIREKEQEKRVNDMNMSFFLNISHEMRTPLTMIKGPLEMLASDESMSEENRKLLGMTTRNVNRLLRFVSQLMDVSKIDNGSMRLEVGYSDIVGVVNQMVDVFALNATEKGITLVRHGLEDKYITLINEDKIEKIVSNLVTNAIKFTPSGGRIDICFDVISGGEAGELFSAAVERGCGTWVKISVADTGIGIPADNLERIFERYFQVRHTGSAVKNYGTGIGLYYAHSLVELHHGFIKAENRDDDTSGARFTFIIPADESAYEVDERRYGKEAKSVDVVSSIVTASPSSMTTSEENRQRLLIVEDETEMARLLRILFEKEYAVVNAYDAESALASIEESMPDIIVSDVVMPGVMDGYALCRKVKDALQTSHIPVVLLTAKCDVGSQVEGLDAGADAYVMKPFEPSYLLALVGSLLTNRDRIRGLLGKVTHTQTIGDEKISPYDKEFLDSLYGLMEKELSNPELNINRMIDVLKIGRTRFYYKVKALTGESPNVFFRTYKLNRSAELLAGGKHSISEVADMIGFSTLSHFSTSFKKQFGCSPSEWMGEHRKAEGAESASE